MICCQLFSCILLFRCIFDPMKSSASLFSTDANINYKKQIIIIQIWLLVVCIYQHIFYHQITVILSCNFCIQCNVYYFRLLLFWQFAAEFYFPCGSKTRHYIMELPNILRFLFSRNRNTSKQLNDITEMDSDRTVHVSSQICMYQECQPIA